MNKQLNILKNKQKGIVLFIALVALVVMSIASVALIRSVDTNTKIAGNLSFKQSALTAADRGVEAALTWLESQTALDTAIKASGYYAIYADLDAGASASALNLDSPAVLESDAIWDGYSKLLVTGADIDSTTGENTKTRNTIRYIIERMCTKQAPPTNDATNQCLFGANVDNNGSHGSAGYGDAPPTTSSSTPIYRITVRVTGPRPQNAKSYTQAYAY